MKGRGNLNKTTKVREWLQSGKPITSMEAWENWGVTRLSAIIFNLRKEGLNIVTNTLKTKTRYGDTCLYAQYELKEDL